MKKYKKGDWIITEYNKYPVQLEEDGKYGYYSPLISGLHFFECSEKEAKELEVDYCYAVRDPRDGLMYYEGWTHPDNVRLAKKSDFNVLIEYLENQIKQANINLKTFIEIAKNSS